DLFSGGDFLARQRERSALCGGRNGEDERECGDSGVISHGRVDVKSGSQRKTVAGLTITQLPQIVPSTRCQFPPRIASMFASLYFRRMSPSVRSYIRRG